MRSLAIAFVLTCLVLSASASGTPAAAASTPAERETDAPLALTSSTAPPWWIDRIDRPRAGVGPDRGAYTSIAFAGSTPYVSYYATTTQDLKLAHPVNSGGNCGPNNSWQCDVIDSTGDVGQFSSIAVDPSTSDLHLGIAYYDLTSDALKYASYSCPIGICGWSTQFIAVHGYFGPANVGRHASLKFDSTGRAHIAATEDVALPSNASYLFHAYSVASSGNCGYSDSFGQWSCNAVDSVGTLSSIRYTSIDLDGLNRPYISYYDAVNHDLKFARYLGSGGNCGIASDWQCTTIDSTGDVGMYSSLAINHSNPTLEGAIAYYDATNFALKFASFGCSTCGANTYTVFNPATGLAGMHTSLRYDANGAAHIAFEHTDIGADILRHAYTVASGGNCGEGTALGHWQCDTVDNSGSGLIAEGDFTALGINPDGLVTIAYHESTFSPSTGYLKVAHQEFRDLLPLLLK